MRNQHKSVCCICGISKRVALITMDGVNAGIAGANTCRSQSGRVPAPQHPMTKERLQLTLWKLIDQKGEVSSPFMDFPSTKGHFIAPWNPRPTLRGLDAVSVSALNLYQGSVLGCGVEGPKDKTRLLGIIGYNQVRESGMTRYK